MNQKLKERLEKLRWKPTRTPREEEEFQRLNKEYLKEDEEK